MQGHLKTFAAFFFCFLYSGCALATSPAPKSLPLSDNLKKEKYEEVNITADDGINIEAILFNPEPEQEGGKNPTLIFISSWGLNRFEYVEPAREYADRGYTVLSYTARGFWGSGGEINLAGLLDQADVSTAIDWVIANTNADPERIGLSGISYGGGLSLLGCAKDPRVKSIAAMSGWVDLAESFLGNGETIRKEAVRLLQVAAELTGRPSDELETVFDDYFSNTNLDFLYETTYNSSAVNFLDGINKNGPAVFVANSLGDSLFTPNQFINFFAELTVPKHLEYAPGDHAGPELLGLFGIPNQVWSRAQEWNDFYLLENHARGEVDADLPQVVFNNMNGDEIEGYATWDDVTTSTFALNFAADEKLVDAGNSPVATTAASKQRALSGASQGDEATTLAGFTTGKGCGVNGGVAYITSTVESYVDVQKPYRMRSIDRDHGAVFQSDKVDTAHHFRGIPELDLSFVPAASNGTLVVYLLSVDRDGVWGHLFSFTPWTFKEAVPGQANTITAMPLTMVAYDMDEGHSLAVVLGSHDPLFLDQSPPDVQISLLEGTQLRMPVNEAW